MKNFEKYDVEIVSRKTGERLSGRYMVEVKRRGSGRGVYTYRLGGGAYDLINPYFLKQRYKRVVV